MYSADGIDITHSQYVALRYLSTVRFVENQHDLPDRIKLATCCELQDLGLAYVAPHYDEPGLYAIRISLHGTDWLYSYDAAQRDKKRMSRRDWYMLFISAILSGLIAFAVSLATNAVVNG